MHLNSKSTPGATTNAKKNRSTVSSRRIHGGVTMASRWRHGGVTLVRHQGAHLGLTWISLGSHLGLTWGSLATLNVIREAMGGKVAPKGSQKVPKRDNFEARVDF